MIRNGKLKPTYYADEEVSSKENPQPITMFTNIQIQLITVFIENYCLYGIYSENKLVMCINTKPY